MNTSPFSALSEAIKKVDSALSKACCTFCDSLCDYVREIEDARRKEIERLEAEALERANEEYNKEAVPFDVMLEKLEAFEDDCHSITRQENAMFWDEDARLLELKVAARQREILRAMQDESARRAMKRRKMMHDEGHFPDSILLAGKQA